MGLRLWLYLPSVSLQGAVNRIHPEARVCFDFPAFSKEFSRTVAAAIARITYENMLLGSAPCFSPRPQVYLHFLVESKRQQLIVHHTNQIVSRQAGTTSSLACMVFVHVCAGEELQEAIKKLEQEALERARR